MGMGKWIFVVGVFALVFLQNILKRLLSKGQIMSSFIVDEENNKFLFQFIDYQTSQWARSGSYETHRLKLRKINLNTLKSEFQITVKSYSSGVLHGGGDVIGYNSKYVFINIYDTNLIVVDAEKGKIVARKKTILKKNPKIKNFGINDILYSKELESVIIYDNRGVSYYLDADTLILKRLKRLLHEKETVDHLFRLKDLPMTAFRKYDFSQKESGLYYFPDDLEVSYLPEEGTARNFIHIEKKRHDRKINVASLDEAFLRPMVLSFDTKAFPYVNKKNPTLIVLHLPEFNPNPDEIMLSAVVGKSKVLWTHKLADMFVKPRFGSDNKLYYIEFEKTLVLFMLSGNGTYKMSLSEVDKADGAIVTTPVQYINRIIKF